MTIYIKEQMDWMNHTQKVVDQNPLVLNYYYGHLPYGHYYK